MRHTSRFAAALAGVALVTAACGDGPTATTGDPLSEVEVQELATEIFASLTGFLAGDFSPHRQALPPAGFALSVVGSIPVNLSIDESGPCDGGGTASVTGSIDGSIDDETGAGTLEFDLTQGFAGCLIAGEAHSYTVHGEPNIRLTGDFESDGATSITGTFRYRGGLGFTVDDGRSGTCGIDATVTIEVSQTAFSGSASGTMCGVSLNNMATFGS